VLQFAFAKLILHVAAVVRRGAMSQKLNVNPIEHGGISMLTRYVYSGPQFNVKYFFYFSFSAEKGGSFYFLVIFRPKK